MIGFKPGTNGFGVVVGATGKVRSTAFVANAFSLRFLKRIVVTSAAFGASISTANALNHRFVINLHFDHKIEFHILFYEHLVQRLGLRGRAWWVA